MRYINKQNGKVAEVIKQDDKAATYKIRFIADGTTKDISYSTFKRWYKKIDTIDPEEIPDDQYTAEIMAQKKDLGIECPEIKEVELVPMPGAEKLADLKEEYCGDGTKYAEVGKQIAEQAKQKAVAAKREKAAREKKAPKVDIAEAQAPVSKAITDLGLIVKTYAGSSRNFTVKNEAGKTVCEVYFGSKKFALMVRANQVPEGYTADRVRNCPSSHAFDFAYSEVDRFTNLLNTIKEEN